MSGSRAALPISLTIATAVALTAARADHKSCARGERVTRMQIDPLLATKTAGRCPER
jgi:hypothetical protein